uniref:EGF-like domain-containing protein n=1 Tax=Anopheles culicifacies TaxID=139723 RepID=A0A182LZ50_9DIPT
MREVCRKVPKLVKNQSQIIKYGDGTYYCMFSEYAMRIPILVDALSCSIDYDVHKKRACCEGYHAVGDECLPSCRLKCIFGECIAPDTCDCYSGYKKVNDHRCEPVCEVPCENGLCVAPNVCHCDAGFELDALSGSCRRKCDRTCRFGRCIDDVCQCDEGYRPDPNDGNACVAHCKEECQHGVCVLPNVCQCEAGYTLSTVSNFTCEPVCPEGCANGNCIGPHQCACHEGYELDDSNRCVPVCLKPCQGGQCIAPGKCSCGEGYSPAENDESVCIPSCSEPCINGDCVAPNTCLCHRNFRPRDYDTPNVCVPDCRNGCVNGVCSGAGVCQCAEGFLYNETAAINSKASICTPYCKNKCVNAYCIRPNVCQCLAGHRFVENSTSVCEPICEDNLVDCSNGRCTQPNVCECNEGYTLAIRNGRMLCEPETCREHCVNGYCVEEGRCECHPGYRPSQQFHSVCEPTCAGGCENGACIAPNTCVCNTGFVRLPGSDRCEASCDPNVVDCYNGVCLGSNQCQCLEGYYLRVPMNGRPAECVPVCENGCANGRCLAPNECLCNDGFEYRVESDQCEPICAPGCMNGICIAPNVCQCLEGYTPVEDPASLEESRHECAPYCDPNVVNCTFGICGGPNVCRCFDDFFSTTDQHGRQTCELLPEPVECGKDVIIYEVENISRGCVCEKPKECPTLSCPEIPTPVCNVTCPPPPPPPTPCPKVVCPTVPPTKPTTKAPTVPPVTCPPVQSCKDVICPTVAPPECPTTPAPQPVCDELYVQCEHGDCIENNVCSCHKGYQLAVGPESIVHCQPVCSGDCTNGICTEPDVCVCLPGYVETFEGRCEPYCDEPCGNGMYCAQPNICVCQKGLIPDGNGNCHQPCQPECVNGECIDGRCFCEMGAVLRQGHICVEAPKEVEDLFIRSRFAVEDDEDDEDEEDEDDRGELHQEPLSCPDGFRSVPATGECICDSGTIAADGSCISMDSVDQVKLLDMTMQRIVEEQETEPINGTNTQPEPIQLAESSLLSGIDRTQWIIVAVVICGTILIVTASVLIWKCIQKKNSMETDID